MNILLTNDDGINAPGLWALAEALQKEYEVMVVAPDREQSGIGTAVTLHYPIRVHPIQPPLAGVEAYAIEGTPTDSIVLAVNRLAKKDINLVISGINQGANLSNDIFISGTVAAALQGYFYGIPSIAVSIAAFDNLYFDPAAKLAVILAKKFKENILPKKLILNINLPNLPLDKIQGLEITRLAEKAYSSSVEPGHNGKKEVYWIRRAKFEPNADEGTDAWTIKQNKISITPLFSSPNGSLFSLLKNLAPNLLEELNQASQSLTL